MYIETKGKNCGQNVFVRFERRDIIQIINFTFYYIQFSAGNSEPKRRFRKQVL